MSRRQFITLIGSRGAMIEKTVRVVVGGAPHEVAVFQTSKSVWVASGQNKGVPIQAKGRNEGSAVKLWRKIAEYWRR